MKLFTSFALISRNIDQKVPPNSNLISTFFKPAFEKIDNLFKKNNNKKQETNEKKQQQR